MPLNHRHGAVSTRPPETRSYTASPELLALMARKPTAAPDIVAGFETGEILTVPARKPVMLLNRATRRLEGRFTQARYQRSPDRERSLHRRRMLAATWPAPPAMCGHLTTSQVAYARIVSDEVSQHGRCDRTLDEIAARGGMCRKTAKRAQDRLKALGWITVEERAILGRKHLPNIVRVVSVEWQTWITMGPGHRSTGGHSSPTTVNHIILKRENSSTAPVDGLQRGLARGRIARFGPSSTPYPRRE